jgi:hypothetical protein
MAGMFYFGICLSFIMTGISFSATYLIPVLVIGMPYAHFFVLVFWGLTILLWYGVLVGHNVRSTRKSVDIFSEDEESGA